MLSDFGAIFLFILAGIALMLLMLGLTRLLRPHRPGQEKLTAYESGEEPEGNAAVPFNVRYYVLALVFIFFEVELVFLFPWATVFANRDLQQETNQRWGWFAFTEMLLFVALLGLGLAYAWRKGHLDRLAPRPQPAPPPPAAVPEGLYEKVNERYQ